MGSCRDRQSPGCKRYERTLRFCQQAATAEARAAEARAAADAADAARDDAEAALEAAMERIVAAERKASEVRSAICSCC